MTMYYTPPSPASCSRRPTPPPAGRLLRTESRRRRFPIPNGECTQFDRLQYRAIPAFVLHQRATPPRPRPPSASAVIGLVCEASIRRRDCVRRHHPHPRQLRQEGRGPSSGALSSIAVTQEQYQTIIATCSAPNQDRRPVRAGYPEIGLLAVGAGESA